MGADDTITLTREQLLETAVEHSQKIDNRSISMLIAMHLTSFCETLFEKYEKDTKTYFKVMKSHPTWNVQKGDIAVFVKYDTKSEMYCLINKNWKGSPRGKKLTNNDHCVLLDIEDLEEIEVKEDE